LEAAVHSGVAAIREANVFGAEGLRDDQALDALLSYEVLFAMKPELYRFEHEIVVGYLVSTKLGREWPLYAALLSERNLDEAWVLAAHDVPPAEQENFFKKLCEVNIVLAAHAAIECGRGAPFVESTLLSRLSTGGESVVSRQETYAGIAVMATPACIAELKQITQRTQPRTDEHDHAMRALCLAGDRDTLVDVLLEAEAMQSMPGLTVSGGAVTWWYSAPAQVALALARERVAGSSSERLSASLWTIALYGDNSDIPSLLKVIQSTKDFYSMLRAYHAMSEFDEMRAREALLPRTEALPPSARIRVLLELGAKPEDAGWLLDVVFQGDPGEEDEDSDPFAATNALKLLSQIALPEDVRKSVREAYEDGDIRIREALWQIATSHKLDSFEVLAVEAVRSADSTEAGLAANFAANHTWQDARLQNEFHELVRDAVKHDWFAYDWHGWRLMAFLLAVGDRDIAASAIVRHLRALVEASEQHRRGARPSLTCRGVDILADADDEGIRSYIGRLVAMVLDEAAAVADRLPSDVTLGLLSVNLRMYSNSSALLTIVKTIDAESIDAALGQVDDEFVKLEVACMLAQLGATESRLTIIGNGFARFLNFPVLVNHMVEAAEHVWSDAMLQRIIDAVILGWNDQGNDTRVYENGLAKLGSLVTRAQAKNIIEPALPRVRAPRALRMLEFWCEVAARRRES
jgi:hypothetical protein